MCIVPRLTGLKLADAKVLLTLGRCRVGKVTKVPAPTAKRRGRVLSQSKKAGRHLAIGAKVAVRVGS